MKLISSLFRISILKFPKILSDSLKRNREKKKKKLKFNLKKWSVSGRFFYEWCIPRMYLPINFCRIF